MAKKPVSKKTKPTLRVEKTDSDSLTFRVESEDYQLMAGETWQDHSYLVDLETNPVKYNDAPFRNGWCGCQGFGFRHQKNVDLGHRSRCKHIDAAVEFYANLKAIEESTKRKAPPEKKRMFETLFGRTD